MRRFPTAGNGPGPHFCDPGQSTGDVRRAAARRRSTLARLETRVGLADHEDLATATNDLAVTVTGLRRLQGGQDLHDEPRRWDDGNKPAILAGCRGSGQVAGPTGETGRALATAGAMSAGITIAGPKPQLAAATHA